MKDYIIKLCKFYKGCYKYYNDLSVFVYHNEKSESERPMDDPTQYYIAKYVIGVDPIEINESKGSVFKKTKNKLFDVKS